MSTQRPPIALVFNPAAGRGNEGRAARIQELLNQTFSVQLLETTEERDAGACAADAIRHGARMVVAAGGDGTVGAVAEVLRHTRIPLGIIPCGTANSVAAALQLPSDVDGACLALVQGIARCMDTAVCNGRSMVLMASVGLHAETISDTPRDLKNRWGRIAYVMEGLQKLRELNPFHVTIETDALVVGCDAVAVTVANMAPVTTVLAQGPATVQGDDGLLDITIVSANSVLDAVAAGAHLLATAAAKAPATRDNVGYLQARSAHITTDRAQRLMVDGEDAGEGPLQVTCEPQSLWVMVPRGPPPAPTQKLDGLPNLSIRRK